MVKKHMNKHVNNFPSFVYKQMSEKGAKSKYLQEVNVDNILSLRLFRNIDVNGYQIRINEIYMSMA